MLRDLHFDESLAQRLPLPLARLYRRAHNAKSALEQHLTAFSLWEASLKLLASTAIVEYAAQSKHDPEMAEVLQNLARPSLGHWWDFARRLVPILADGGDAGFQQLRELILGKTRDDLPRAAGLDAALREALGQSRGAARATVRLTELFDRLVRYRNTVLLGHAAPGQLKEAAHELMGAALLAGTAELLGRLDVLAGRRLIYVGDVRQSGGVWLVQRFALSGESPQRLAAQELPRNDTARLPDGERLYLDGPDSQSPWRALHPLLLYDAEAEDALFLNARRGKGRTEYLCYTSGRTAERQDLGGEQRSLLANALGITVSAEQMTAWAARSQTGEQPEEAQGDAEHGQQLRRTLGEFELLSELGKGGMGVVYRAWQPSLGRQVALKKLLRVGDAKTEARFRREIKALGQVEHPHLVHVFTSGSDGEQWFYAMELVEGTPLSTACERLQASGSGAGSVDLKTWHDTISTVCLEARRAEKPLGDAGLQASGQGANLQPTPPHITQADSDGSAAGQLASGSAGRAYARQVAELLRQVAEAADALHDKGVIHRDIKPGNIMVTAGGSHAVLMDLGLAQLADDEEGRLTRTRQFVGTLRYASPEQLAGAQLDRRADVYSLGASLWEVLALRPLYGIDEQTPTPDAILKVQQSEPERLRKYHPCLSPDLEAVVFKCLEKDPQRRYASAAELAQDLSRYLNGEPVRARTVRGWERAWKWAKRRPAVASLIAVSAAALVTLVAGLIGFTVQAQDARRRAEADAAAQAELRHEADKRKLEAIASEAEMRAVLEFFEQKVMSAARPKDQAGGLGLDATIRAAVDAAEPKIAETFRDKPRVEAAIRSTLGLTYWYLGEAQLAIRQHERALELHKLTLGSEHPDTLASMNNLAKAYQNAGRLNDALPLYEQTLKLRKAVLGPDHPDTMISMNNLAVAYGGASRPQEAVGLFEQTLKLNQANLGLDHPDTLRTMNNLASAYKAMGRLNDALPLYLEALKRRQAKLGPEHADTLTTLNNLATAYLDLGRSKDALPLLIATLKLCQAKLGPDHPDTIRTMKNLAAAYWAAGRLSEALPLLEEALKLSKAKLGPGHPDTLLSMNSLAIAYRTSGRLNDALVLLEKALEVSKAKLGAEHSNTLMIANSLALAYWSADRLNDALLLFATTADAARRKLGLAHPQTKEYITNYAACFEALDSWDKAETLRRELVTYWQEKTGPDSSEHADQLEPLGRNLLQQHKDVEAEAVLRTCLSIREKKQPGGWRTFNTRSLLGASLLGQKKYFEAEPLLVTSFEAMKQLAAKAPAPSQSDLIDAIGRLVRLYEATARQEQAEKWRRELETARAK